MGCLPLSETELETLGNVVLSPEEGALVPLGFNILEWIRSWKEITGQWLERVTLRWIDQLGCHDSLLRPIVSHSSKELVLVDEC